MAGDLEADEFEGEFDIGRIGNLHFHAARRPERPSPVRAEEGRTVGIPFPLAVISGGYQA